MRKTTVGPHYQTCESFQKSKNIYKYMGYFICLLINFSGEERRKFKGRKKENDDFY